MMADLSAAEILKKAEAAARREQLEKAMLVQIRAAKLEDGMVREHRFHANRKWRMDFAWPDLMVALEVEGVTYQGGRHQRVDGFTQDCIKYNQATLRGWRLIRATGRMITSGAALVDLETMLAFARAEQCAS